MVRVLDLEEVLGMAEDRYISGRKYMGVFV